MAAHIKYVIQEKVNESWHDLSAELRSEELAQEQMRGLPSDRYRVISRKYTVTETILS